MTTTNARDDVKHLTTTQLERIMESELASPRAKRAASDEWHDRMEERARSQAVAAFMNGMEGRD